MTADDVPPRKRPAPVRAWLEFDLDAQPIEGTLSSPDSSPSPFVGWLGLTAALEALRAARTEGKEAP